MISYKYLMPTTVMVGQNVVLEKAYLMEKLGKKAVIVTSQFPEGTVNQALLDTKEALQKLGVEYMVIDDCPENPPIYAIEEMTKRAFPFHPDFVVACGGGSSIDASKAMTVLISHPGEDPFDVFYKKDGETQGASAGSASHDAAIVGFGDGSIPLVAIPTTAGTGSEVTHAAVLTNERIGTKMSMKQRVFPTISYVDYRYIKTCPQKLLHAAAMDALTHGVEATLNNLGTFITRAYAKIGFGLFARFKDHLLTGNLTDEDYECMMAASDIFGFSEMYSTTITHGMGYPLTEEKNVPHGLACAVFLGEFLRNFKDQALTKPVYEACGFSSVDEFADYVNAILQPHVDFTCTMEEIDRWTDEMIDGTQKWRIAKNPEPLTKDDIRNIYIRSLGKAIR